MTVPPVWLSQCFTAELASDSLNDPNPVRQLDAMRRELPGTDPNFFRIWWQERLRAARRVFNDPDRVDKIVAILEAGR